MGHIVAMMSLLWLTQQALAIELDPDQATPTARALIAAILTQLIAEGQSLWPTKDEDHTLKVTAEPDALILQARTSQAQARLSILSLEPRPTLELEAHQRTRELARALTRSSPPEDRWRVYIKLAEPPQQGLGELLLRLYAQGYILASSHIDAPATTLGVTLCLDSAGYLGSVELGKHDDDCADAKLQVQRDPQEPQALYHDRLTAAIAKLIQAQRPAPPALVTQAEPKQAPPQEPPLIVSSELSLGGLMRAGALVDPAAFATLGVGQARGLSGLLWIGITRAEEVNLSAYELNAGLGPAWRIAMSERLALKLGATVGLYHHRYTIDQSSGSRTGLLLMAPVSASAALIGSWLTLTLGLSPGWSRLGITHTKDQERLWRRGHWQLGGWLGLGVAWSKD